MRIQELIRGILDMIDGVDAGEEVQPVAVHVAPGNDSPFTHAGDDINRFKQIVDLADTPNCGAEYANEPNEKYATIDAVTVDAGGGLNGPKHPADIRADSVAMYPGHVHGEK